MTPRTSTLTLLFALLFAAGCSTATGGLAYQPTAPPSVMGAPTFTVAPVVDQRANEAHELGTVRGGYGNVLKRLTTDRPVAELVRGALQDALRARGLLAADGEGKIELRPTLAKLDCNYFFNREAHTQIAVEAYDASSGSFLWRNSYSSDVVESGAGAGIFADVDHLRGMAIQSMSKAVTDAANDAQLRAAAPEQPTAASGS